MQIIKCLTCKKDIEVTEYEFRVGRKKFCSRTCLGVQNVKIMNAVRPVPTANAGSFKKGHGAGVRHSEWAQGRCRNCGKQFERPAWMARRNNGEITYCSNICRDEYRKNHEAGENSPFWVGGPVVYRGRDWEKTRARIVKKQKGVCAECKKHIGESLHVHHKKPFREFSSAEEANHDDNLVGLCGPCHSIADKPFKKRKAG